MPGEEKALAEMTRHTLFRVANGSEVDFLVPVEKQVKISESLAQLGGRQVQTEGFEELPKAGFIEHGGILDSSSRMCKARSMFHVEHSNRREWGHNVVRMPYGSRNLA